MKVKGFFARAATPLKTYATCARRRRNGLRRDVCFGGVFDYGYGYCICREGAFDYVYAVVVALGGYVDVGDAVGRVVGRRVSRMAPSPSVVNTSGSSSFRQIRGRWPWFCSTTRASFAAWTSLNGYAGGIWARADAPTAGRILCSLNWRQNAFGYGHGYGTSSSGRYYGSPNSRRYTNSGPSFCHRKARCYVSHFYTFFLRPITCNGRGHVFYATYTGRRDAPPTCRSKANTSARLRIAFSCL